MRNKFLLLGGAFVILLILLAVLLRSDPVNENTATNESSSPNPFEAVPDSKKIIDKNSALGTVTSCFNWYIQGITKNGDAWYAAEQKQINDCFTEEYVSQFASIISRTGSDPVLSVQDIYNSWSSPAKARILIEDTTAAKAEVTIGSQQELTTYRVDIVWSEEKKWRISSVTKVESI